MRMRGSWVWLWAWLSLGLVPSSAAADTITAAEPLAVPPRFQGQWGSDQKHCGTDDDSRLTIGAGQIRFYESGGSIKAVVMQGQSDLAVIIALSGEGETWLDYRHFRLSADGKTLTDVTVEPELVRHRCPKGT